MSRVFVYEGREFEIDGNCLRLADKQTAELMPVKEGRRWYVKNFWGEYRLDSYQTKALACEAIVAVDRVPVREFALSIRDRALTPKGRPFRS